MDRLDCWLQHGQRYVEKPIVGELKLSITLQQSIDPFKLIQTGFRIYKNQEKLE